MHYRLAIVVVALLGGIVNAAQTANADEELRKVDQAALQDAVAKGIDFLRAKGQADNGSYSERMGPGCTALATMAVLRHGRSTTDPQVAKSLAFLEAFVQPDGSITPKKPSVANYETSLSANCFALANKDGKYQKIIDDAKKYLSNVQLDEGENRTPADKDYGGVGYNSKTPGGDLSNTHTLLDSLQAAGTGPDDPAVKRALIFVSRCQNLESEHNTLAIAAKINDGGFYYSPNAEGYSAAGKGDKGEVRSYGSMTYAGLKSMLYAGVDANDQRVVAAKKWLQKHYSVEENPGLGQAGLYYYYHLMGKALNAVGSPTIEDASGKQHAWRAELAEAIIKRQRPDGSWINENNRWYEGDPNLSTSFALLALAYCQAEVVSR